MFFELSELGEFPHRQDNAGLLIPLPQKQHLFHRGEEQQSFSQRFPWLTFSSDDDRNKFIYQGREGEVHHPHFVRFHLREQPKSTNPNASISQINKLAQARISTNVSETLLKECKEGKFGRTNDKGQNDNMSYGYLFMGIAKPTATANYIFDTLISEGVRDSPSGSEQGSRMSRMSGESKNDENAPLGYKLIKYSWEAKLKSFQYFKFMSRIFKELKDRGLEDRKAMNEMFYNGGGRSITYSNKQTDSNLTISDQEYFNYFSRLFNRHGLRIYDQIQSFQRNNTNLQSASLTIELPSLTLNLQRINYRFYVQTLFEGLQLEQSSLTRIIKYHQENHDLIVNGFQFKTKEERLERLRLLKTIDRKGEYWVDLVPLRQAGSVQPSAHDNYLVVLTSERGHFQTSLKQEVTLQQVISGVRKGGDGSLMEGTKLQNNKLTLFQLNLFRHIYNLGQLNSHNSKQGQIIRHMSLNPKYVLFDAYTGNCNINFDHALNRALKLQALPLTHEQQMLQMTPSQHIDLYSTFEKLMEDLHPSLKDDPSQIPQDYYSGLCNSLSNSNLKFSFNPFKYAQIRKFKSRVKPQDLHAYTELNNNLDLVVRDLRRQSQLSRMMSGVKRVKEMKKKYYSQFLKQSLKYVSSEELFSILMLSMINYQNKVKEKCLLSAKTVSSQLPFTQEGDLQSRLSFVPSQNQQYHRSSPQEQKEAYQFSMLILIFSGVVEFIDCKETKEANELDSHQNWLRIQQLLQKYYLGLLMKYFRFLSQKRIAGPQVSLGLQVRQEGNHFSKIQFLFRTIADRKYLLKTEAFIKSITKASLILQLYREWLFVLRGVLKVNQIYQGLFREELSQEEQQNLRDQRTELLQTLEYAYQTMQLKQLDQPIFRSIKPKEDKYKVQFKSLQSVLLQAQGRKKVYQFFINNSRPPFEEIVQKIGELSQRTLKGNMQGSKGANKSLIKEYFFIEEQIKGSIMDFINKQIKRLQDQQTRLFCHLYLERQPERDRMLQINQEEEVQSEKLNTIQTLAFFLYGSANFKKEHLNFIQNRSLSAKETDFKIKQLSQLMIIEIQTSLVEEVCS